jgi:hypothetical protein
MPIRSGHNQLGQDRLDGIDIITKALLPQSVPRR